MKWYKKTPQLMNISEGSNKCRLVVSNIFFPFHIWDVILPIVSISVISIVIYKVVPQFGIAKLVHITPISLWFMVDILTYLLWFLLTNSFHWGAPPCSILMYLGYIKLHCYKSDASHLLDLIILDYCTYPS